MLMPNQKKSKRRRSQAERIESASTSRTYNEKKRNAGYTRVSSWVLKDDLAQYNAFVEGLNARHHARVRQELVLEILRHVAPVKKPSRKAQSDIRQIGFDLG